MNTQPRWRKRRANQNRSMFRRIWALLIAGALLTLTLLVWLVRDAQAFCNDRDDGSKCHPQLVEEALGFLQPDVLRAISGNVNAPDDVSFLDYASDDHFDDCNFDGSTERINTRYLAFIPGTSSFPAYLGVVPFLSPFHQNLGTGGTKDTPGVFAAAERWAWLLHAVQDFYSHSNWIEMGFTDWRTANDLIDSRLARWQELPSDWGSVRQGVVASQDDLPSGWTMTYPNNPRVPVVTVPGGQRYMLLVSGETGNPAQSCPDGAHLSHDDVLNKDNITRPYYAQARDMAIAQTRHEWCRLLYLTRQANGFPGASVPMGLLVSPTASPHPAWTPCAELPTGPVQINVRVTRLKIVDNGDDSGSQGQLNYIFTLYTDDLRRSVRAQTPTIFATSGTLVPSGQLPASLSLCMSPSEQLIATVQGWDDDDDVGTPKLGTLDDNDDARAGATYVAGRGSDLSRGVGVGTFDRDSDNSSDKDVEVRFVVNNERTDADGDGLTYCSELAAGLNPNDADSDNDGLPDGAEARVDTGFGTFGPFGRAQANFGEVYERAFAVAAQSDGSIIAAGEAATDGINHKQVALARYLSTGALDNTFGDNGTVLAGLASDDAARSVAVLPSGKIVAAGFRQGQDYDFAVWRFNTDGTPDASFNLLGFNVADFGLGDDFGQVILIQSNEKIVVAGSVASPTSVDFDRRLFGLARFNTNGTLDRSFGGNGWAIADVGSGFVSARAAILQSDGKILVAGGHAGNFVAARFTAAGALDDTFSGDGIVEINLPGNDEARALGLMPDGTIAVAGYSSGDWALVFLTSAGGLVNPVTPRVLTDFGGDDIPYALSVQGDGKILVAGAARGDDPIASRFYLARYKKSLLSLGYGPDAGFGNGGRLVTAIANRDVARAMALAPGGRIVVAGYSHNGRDDDFTVVRYRNDYIPLPVPDERKTYLPIVIR